MSAEFLRFALLAGALSGCTAVAGVSDDYHLASRGGGGTGGASGGSGGAGGAPGGTTGAGGTAGKAGAAGTAGAGGAAGNPGTCAAGAYRCQGDVFQRCAKDLTTWTNVATCKPGLCDVANGACAACAASTMFCIDEKTSASCDVTGQTAIAKPCVGSTPLCVGSGTCGCTKTSDCPAATGECVAASCAQSQCTTAKVPPGSKAATQTAGDCRANTCDPAGSVVSVIDDTDLPPNGGNDCTGEACMGGVPSHPPKAQGTPCSGGTCDGLGKCGGCQVGSTRCAGNAVQTCTTVNVWANDAPCVAPSPVCSAGTCVHPTQVVTGADHACALLHNGRVTCWGSNALGQLGNGAGGPGVMQALPAEVQGLAGVTALSAFKSGTIALLSNGTLLGWGRNAQGELGNGTPVPEYVSTPMPIAGMSGVTAIVSGRHHTCGILNDKSVKCFGENLDGTVGNGTTTAAAPPTQVTGLATTTRIWGGGYLTCAEDSGHIFCWGDDTYGQIGIATANDLKTFPTETVGDSTGSADMALGAQHTCILGTNGGISCAGNDAQGQLGNGSAGGVFTTFQSVAGLPSVLRLSGANTHTCALSSNGAVYCWGANDVGQCGTGMVTPSPITSPAQVTLLEAQALSLGGGTSAFTCAITTSSEVKCWGYGVSGQLGNGSVSSTATPTLVAW